MCSSPAVSRSPAGEGCMIGASSRAHIVAEAAGGYRFGCNWSTKKQKQGQRAVRRAPGMLGPRGARARVGASSGQRGGVTPSSSPHFMRAGVSQLSLANKTARPLGARPLVLVLVLAAASASICAPGSSQTTHCLEPPPHASLLCVLVAHPFLIRAAPNSPLAWVDCLVRAALHAQNSCPQTSVRTKIRSECSFDI